MVVFMRYVTRFFVVKQLLSLPFGHRL